MNKSMLFQIVGFFATAVVVGLILGYLQTKDKVEKHNIEMSRMEQQAYESLNKANEEVEKIKKKIQEIEEQEDKKS